MKALQPPYGSVPLEVDHKLDVGCCHFSGCVESDWTGG